MKKFVLAGICTLSLVSFVLADQFGATITSIETKGGATTISFTKKGKMKGETGDKGTAVLASDAKVVKGKFDADAKKMVAGDAIEGGIKADMFKEISADKGVGATITIADDGANKGKITEIIVGGGGKAGGKGGKKGGGKGG